ncbi:hypothetical protein ACN27F_23330 [Solwaraspora sp. WMMB335]|uniref:hypothetical protein n=1 Tax=Solwaraspora sp. WMMB335 TaxID=3404118 RepID=UPI003B93850F
MTFLARITGEVAGLRGGMVLSVLVLGLASRVSISLGGFAAADYLVRNQNVLGVEVIAARMRASAIGVSGLVIAVAAGAVGCSWWLASQGGSADRLVVALVGVCLMLRSRLFEGTRSGIVLLVAGGVDVASAAYWLVREPPAGFRWLTPLVIALMASALLAAATGLAAPDGRATSGSRLLVWGETTALIALVCAVAGAWGFGRVGSSAGFG